MLEKRTASRILQSLITLFVLITIVFFLFRLLPGDPTAAMVDPSLSAADRQVLMERFGFDKPLYQQYLLYLKELAKGNLGVSFRFNAPVFVILAEKFLNTSILVVLIFLFSHICGILGGVYLAWYRGSRWEIIGNIVALFLRSAPSFWFGIVMMVIFSFWLNLLPEGGILTPGNRVFGLTGKYLSWDFIYHLILPVLVGTLHYMGLPMLLVRNAMLELKEAGFVEMARAKGLREVTVMFKHAARNALLPVITAGAFFLGRALGGLVLIEFVFSWPGVGREMVNAINGRDYPVAQGAFVMIAVMIISINIITDLIYPYLDPRIEYT
jgi:peptide/nickel transport system permease protein